MLRQPQASCGGLVEPLSPAPYLKFVDFPEHLRGSRSDPPRSTPAAPSNRCNTPTRERRRERVDAVGRIGRLPVNLPRLKKDRRIPLRRLAWSPIGTPKLLARFLVCLYPLYRMVPGSRLV